MTDKEKRQQRKRQGRSIVLSADLEYELAVGNAVRCSGCGYVGTRLQWTHFRTKCSIKSIQEYKLAFPGAEMVATNLRLLTSMTRDNMIAAHGDIEGRSRWAAYCERQSTTNTFDYKAAKYGWSQNDFDVYNASRAVTQGNLIERHGAERGRAIWNSYCERQRYTNTLEYFTEREGNQNAGLDKWLQYNEEKGKSRRVPDIAEMLDITYNNACKLLSERARGNIATSKQERLFAARLNAVVQPPLKYTCETRQFCIWSAVDGRAFFFDARCPVRRKIVEYHGDYYHANPALYACDAVIAVRGETASQVWDYDRRKHQAASAFGFEVRVVWESDYLRHGIPEELIQWLNN